MKKIYIISALLLNALLATAQITYQYDNLYRLQKVEHPNGVVVEYTYDELGNRLTKTVDGIIPVTGVSLDKTTATIPINDTEQLTATVAPVDATNQSVIWSSSNTSVATVANGLVTGIASGTATVTVTTVDGGFAAQCVISVTTGSGTNNPDASPTIYPNPFADYIIVNIPVSQQVSIYNISGQCVYKNTLQAGIHKIDTSHLPNGVYPVKCGSESLKMVK
jgi:YD repeat-containing protein